MYTPVPSKFNETSIIRKKNVAGSFEYINKSVEGERIQGKEENGIYPYIVPLMELIKFKSRGVSSGFAFKFARRLLQHRENSH